MSRHTRPDDEDNEEETENTVDAALHELGYVPTVADTVTRWRYTLSPTTYVNDDSTTDEVLWQLLLEQRATRHWLALIWWTLLWLGIAVGVVIVAVN